MAKKDEIVKARDEMRGRLASDAPMDEDTQAIMDRIEAEMDSATTIEEILAGGTTTPVEEILDQPIILKGYVLRQGDMGKFAVIDCIVRDTGEVIVVSAGGQLVLATLRNLERVHGTVDGLEVEFVQRGRAHRLVFPHDRKVIEAQSS